MTDQEILDAIKLRYLEVAEQYPAASIIGIFTKGSYNYKLADANSDFDTVAIINSDTKKSNYIISRYGKGEIYIKTLDEVFWGLRKSDLLILDTCLFSKYYYGVRPPYEQLLFIRNKIAYMCPNNFAFQAFNNMDENVWYVEAVLRGKKEKYMTQGFKWLCHIIRVKDYLKHYLLEEPFDKIIDLSLEGEEYRRQLLSLKRNEGGLDWDDLRQLLYDTKAEYSAYIKQIKAKWGSWKDTDTLRCLEEWYKKMKELKDENTR